MENFKLVLFLILAVIMAVKANMYYIGVGRADITGPAAEVVMVSIKHSLSCQPSILCDRWVMLSLTKKILGFTSGNGAEPS